MTAGHVAARLDPRARRWGRGLTPRDPGSRFLQLLLPLLSASHQEVGVRSPRLSNPCVGGEGGIPAAAYPSPHRPLTGRPRLRRGPTRPSGMLTTHARATAVLRKTHPR